MSISPTSYSLLQRCPRSWWYQYVAHRPRVSTFALDNGSAVHAAVESYLDTGTWPEGDAPAIVQARRGQAVLDAWKATAGLATGDGWAIVEAEAKRALEPFGGVDTLKGRVDWHGAYDTGATPLATTHPDGSASSPDGDHPWVLDHKTTANPAFWGTSETLALNPQLLAYAGALFPGRDVLVGHVYLPPPPHEPTLVTGLATAASIDAVLADMARATVEMATIRTATSPESVEARTTGCWAFGGCPHADVCTAAPEALRRRHHPTDPNTTTTGAPTMLTEGQLAMRAKMKGISVEALKAEMGIGAPAAVEASAPSLADNERVLDDIAAMTERREEAHRAADRALGVSILPPDAPAAAPANILDAIRDLDDAHALRDRLRTDVVVSQKEARGTLCGALGLATIKAARWTRIVAAGVEAGLFAVAADGALVPSATAAPNRAPSTLPPEAPAKTEHVVTVTADVSGVREAAREAARAVVDATEHITYQHRGRTIAPADVAGVLSAAGAANTGASGDTPTHFFESARNRAEANVLRSLEQGEPAQTLLHLDVLARLTAVRS